MTLNSLKYAGISSSLDWSEDYQFWSFINLGKGNETIELKNEEVLDQEDDYVTSSWLDK